MCANTNATRLRACGVCAHSSATWIRDFCGMLGCCMQIVYRARNTEDAYLVPDILAQVGIPVHVAEAGPNAAPEELIPVLVDNSKVDAARRAIHAARDRLQGITH